MASAITWAARRGSRPRSCWSIARNCSPSARGPRWWTSTASTSP